MPLVCSPALNAMCFFAGRQGAEEITATDGHAASREAREALDVSRAAQAACQSIFLFGIPQGWATYDPAAGLLVL
jgi:hypothetical protein